ncbi:MAG: PilZ domain-containing protein, partial [Desulfobacula sp.]|nr:PilZ domain-containing protein [Desulfobacula sp.]
MEDYEEKRRYQRYEHNSPIYLYLMDSQDQYYYAEMKDYCQGGLSLSTDEKLVVGHLVYLEMENYDEYAKGPEKYKSYFGSVKWATPYSSSDVDTKNSYKYGIEYNEPAY